MPVAPHASVKEGLMGPRYFHNTPTLHDASNSVAPEGPLLESPKAENPAVLYPTNEPDYPTLCNGLINSDI